MKETYRDQRGLPLFEAFLQDLKYAARMLGRDPAFAVVAILSLAIGIGASTAAFSVFNAVMLRPLPVPDSDRLVLLDEQPSHMSGESEHGEVAARDEAGLQVHRGRVPLERDFHVRDVVGGEQARQRRLARAQLLIDWIDDDESLPAALWLEQDEPIGIGDGQRAQHDGVEHAERGR